MVGSSADQQAVHEALSVPALERAALEALAHGGTVAGAEACADGAALARLVEQRLGRPVFTAPSRAERTLEGRIAPRRENTNNAKLERVTSTILFII